MSPTLPCTMMQVRQEPARSPSTDVTSTAMRRRQDLACDPSTDVTNTATYNDAEAAGTGTLSKY